MIFCKKIFFSNIIYLFKYAVSSAIAVLLDFMIFYLLIYYVDCSLFISNIISTITGFFIGWIVSGCTIFRKYNLKFLNYFLWFSFQFFAIPSYSLCLQFFSSLYGNTFVIKAIIIVFSFLINSIYFKFFVLKKYS